MRICRGCRMHNDLTVQSESATDDHRGNDDSPRAQVMATRVGLRFPRSLTFENWQRAGEKIARIVDSSAWCLGDWLIYGELRCAERYRQAIEAVGLDYQ